MHRYVSRTTVVTVADLSYCSIRETAGTKDMAYLQQLFVTFFGRFGEVDDMNVD